MCPHFKRCCLLVIMILAFAGCGGWQSAQEEDIREAVFRYQLDRASRPRVFFLAVGEPGELRDPSDEFMQRFVGHRLVVKKFSECTIVKDEVDRGPGLPPMLLSAVVTAIETGAVGTILEVYEVKWINRREVEVEAGYYAGPLSGSRDLFHVAREGGRWIVKSRTNMWVS